MPFNLTPLGKTDGGNLGREMRFDECSGLAGVNPDIYIDGGKSELLAGIFGARIRKHDKMMTTCWDYAPPAAKNYPGGAAAVYEEAVRRGVTWQEVCGYVPPPYITGFTQ